MREAIFNALKAGITTITYTASNGQSVTVTITILAKEAVATNKAKTGDDSEIILWCLIAVIAVIAIGGLIFANKKYRFMK